MSVRKSVWIGLAVLATMAGAAAAADSDSKSSREREMLRRAQEALRQSQSDNGNLAKQKQDAEQKLKETADQLNSIRNASKSAQASLHTQAQTAAAAQAALNQQLEEANRKLAALTTTQKETAAQLSTREAELKQTQQELQLSKTANTSCEAKNLQLYQYSQAALEQYHKKGVWSALSQKEPVLGLKDVKVENLVQEYQQKIAAQKITPTPR